MSTIYRWRGRRLALKLLPHVEKRHKAYLVKAYPANSGRWRHTYTQPFASDYVQPREVVCCSCVTSQSLVFASCIREEIGQTTTNLCTRSYLKALKSLLPGVLFRHSALRFSVIR